MQNPGVNSQAGSLWRASSPSPHQAGLSVGGVLSILFASTFIIMVGCVVAPTLPEIARHLGMEQHAGWLVTLPSLGVVLAGPIAGWTAARQISSRTSMLVGLLTYGVFGVIAPLLAPWPWLVLGDRLLLGGSTALLLSSSLDIVAVSFHGAARLRMISFQGMATEGGGVILLAVGGVLGALNWRLPFLLYALAFVCFVCVFSTVPKSPAHAPQLLKEAAPGGSGIAGTLLSATLSMMLFFVAILTLPETLSTRMDFGPAETGYVLSYISLCTMVWMGVLPKALRHVRPGRLQCLAFASYGFGHLLFSLTTHVAGLLAAGALMGFGFGFSLPIASQMIMELSPAISRARNLGYLSTCIFLGQVLSSFASYISKSGERIMIVTALTAFVIGAGYWIRDAVAGVSRTALKVEDVPH